jgi:hypothetical protein
VSVPVLAIMEDPYDAVAREVQSSLQSTLTLLASYRRIKSTATEGNEELTWARNEVLVLLVNVLSYIS